MPVLSKCHVIICSFRVILIGQLLSSPSMRWKRTKHLFSIDCSNEGTHYGERKFAPQSIVYSNCIQISHLIHHTQTIEMPRQLFSLSAMKMCVCVLWISLLVCIKAINLENKVLFWLWFSSHVKTNEGFTDILPAVWVLHCTECTLIISLLTLTCHLLSNTLK